MFRLDGDRSGGVALGIGEENVLTEPRIKGIDCQNCLYALETDDKVLMRKFSCSLGLLPPQNWFQLKHYGFGEECIGWAAGGPITYHAPFAMPAAPTRLHRGWLSLPPNKKPPLEAETKKVIDFHELTIFYTP